MPDAAEASTAEIDDLLDLPVLKPDAIGNCQKLKELFGDAEFESLLDKFLKACEARIDGLRHSVGNFDSISYECHSLRGSASNFGAWRLVELCEKGEQLANDHEQRAFDLIDLIVDATSYTSAAIKAEFSAR